MHKANGFTRQEVLATLKMNGPMTAEELGNELGISPVAARQHLAALESEGHVVTSAERHSRGRPVHVYTITARGDETFPRAYDVLANSLLEELRFANGDNAVDTLFQARRNRLRTASEIRVEGKPLASRVAEIARMRSEHGYMSELREENGSYVLVDHNCTICRVARNHPCACEHDVQLIRELCGDTAHVEREQHMMDGDHTCLFRITPRI